MNREIVPQKKNYKKPVLQSRQIKLGVFGDYGDGSDDAKYVGPVDAIKDLHLHME